MFVVLPNFTRNPTSVLGNLVVVIIVCGRRDEPRFGDNKNV